MSGKYNEMSEKSTHKPLITVITAVKNMVNTVERSIQSVIAQSYARVEYIVIDGASTDGTIDILNKYLNYFDYYLSEPDTGVYAAWNKALELATGDWVCFIGADDYFSDNSSLEKLVAAIDVSLTENVAIVYGQLDYVESSKLTVNISLPWEVAQQGVFSFMMIPHVATLHKRSLFDEFGRFDESFKIAGDYEFFLRVFEKYDALFVPEVTQASMAAGGLSSKYENLRCMWTESQRIKQLHPRSRFKYGMWSIVALMKVMRFRMALFLYENFPGSIFHLVRRFYRIIR